MACPSARAAKRVEQVCIQQLISRRVGSVVATITKGDLVRLGTSAGYGGSILVTSITWNRVTS